LWNIKTPLTTPKKKIHAAKPHLDNAVYAKRSLVVGREPVKGDALKRLGGLEYLVTRLVCDMPNQPLPLRSLDASITPAKKSWKEVSDIEIRAKVVAS
jgi:hypothetical protein